MIVPSPFTASTQATCPDDSAMAPTPGVPFTAYPCAENQEPQLPALPIALGISNPLRACSRHATKLVHSRL